MNTKSTISHLYKLISIPYKLIHLHFFWVFLISFWPAGYCQAVYVSTSTDILNDTIQVVQLREKIQQSRDSLMHAPEVSLRLADEITDLILTLPDSLLHAELYYLKGKIHDQLGNYAIAIDNFKACAAIFHLNKKKDEYAQCLNYLGAIYDNLGHYDTALRHYLWSLNALDPVNHRGLIYAHNNIALIYIEAEDYQKSRFHLKKAIQIAREYGPEETLTYPYHNLGDLHYRVGNYDSALYFYQQSYAIDSLTNDHVGLGLNLKGMAEVFKKMDAYPKAKSYLDDALVYFQKSNDKLNLSAAYTSLGEVYLKYGQYPKATLYADKGLKLANELLAKQEIKLAARVLSETYKAQQDHEQALYFTEMYHLYKDSLFNETKSHQLASLQLDQAKTEKELLQMDNELKSTRMNDQQLLIEKQTYIVIFVSFGLIISIVVLVIMHNANRDKKIANQQLLKQKKEIEHIISELKVLNRDIEDQKDKLEGTNRIKDKLISIISHDFRSPLNSLEGVLVLFSEGQISNTEMKPIAHDLRLKVNLTTSLIDNLLNWAKNQMQGISPGPESFDILKLIHETMHLVELQAENKCVEIQNQVTKEQNVQVYADYEMTKLVLRNLISNAIKFTRPNGQIVIRATEKENFISLSVRDSGVGMNGEQLKILFTNQSNSTLGTAHEKGTGLGLMLCKDFVEKNGGQLLVQSLEGEGSTFSFTIPVKPADKTKGVITQKKNELKHV